MQKKCFFIVLFLVPFSMFAADFPRPTNNLMSTEYVSEKKMRYVKKPITAAGKILMYSQDELVYTQDEPAAFVVTKTAKAVTYQREKMAPIRIDLSDPSAAGQNFDIIALFGDDEQVSRYYDIDVSDEGGVSHYTITPKNESKIRQMNALAVGDKLSSLIIFYNDGSTLKYTFRNTVTGAKPADYEKYFK